MPYETGLVKRIRLAVSRFEALGSNLAKGSPKAIQTELDRVRKLREVIGANLGAMRRRSQSRELWARISEIQERELRSRGLLKSLFHRPLSESTRAEIEGLKAQIPQGDVRTAFRHHGDGEMLQSYDKRLASYENVLKRSMRGAKEREQERLKAAEKRAAEKELTRARQAEKKARVVAMAAAHAGKTRRLAQTIRRNIERQRALLSMCPYCGAALGKNPEADHIYPVALGGLSTEENMVFVCAMCNGKKRDKTLREFVKAMNLDLSAVVQRLELLGKRF